MNLTRDQTLVELKPQSSQEVKELGALWNVLVGCVKTDKKPAPIGEYLPGKKEIALFTIED